MRNFIKKYPLLVLIISLAFVIRLIAGGIQSFSNDELSAIYRLQFTKFSDLFHWGIKVDGHPAFVQLFLYYYSLIVPKGEFFLRLPFVVASSLSLLFIFFSLNKLSGEFTATIVVIILAFSGFSIQLGYFARPYAFGILFTSAAMYYWIRIFIDASRQRKYMVAFILFSILAAYTHYFALLQITVLGLATFFFIPRKLWWKIFVSGAIILLAFLPHYPITAFQMSVGGIGGWLGKPKDYFIVNLIFEYFDRSAWLVAAVVIVPMLLIIRQMARPRITITFLFLFLSIVPFCILYFYSIKVNSVLQFSACFFLMPFLLVAFFSLFKTGEEQSTFAHMIQISIMVIFLLSALFFNNVFAPTHFAEFKRIAEYIEEHESDSVTTVVAVNNPFYIDYYLKDKKPDLYITDMGDNLSFLKRFVDSCDTKEFIYAFANQRSNIEIPVLVNNKFHVLFDSKSFMNSELFHFTDYRGNKDPQNFWFGARRFVYDYEQKGFEDMKEAKGNEPFSEFNLDEKDEYSPTLNVKLSNYSLREYDRIIAHAKVQTNNFCDVEIVISVENKEGSVFWRSRKLSQQFYNIEPIEIDSTITLVPNEFKYSYFLSIGESLEDSNVDLMENYLKVYIANPNHCKCRIEDFTIWMMDGNKLMTGYSQ